MNVEGDGFLSNDGSEKSARIVARNSGVFSSFEETIRDCKSFVLSTSMKGQDSEKNRQQIIAIVVAIRLLEICEAALLILKNGMSNEADTLFRVFLDAYFVFANICKDPGFIVEYFKSDEAARLKLLNSVEKHNSELFKEINEYATHELKVQLKQKIKEEKIQDFKSYAYADKAGCAEMYDSLYRLMSAPLHTTPRSLEKYIEEDEHGNITKIKYYPVEDDIPQRAYDFSYHLIKVIGGLKDVFGCSNEIETNAMIEKLNKSIK